jgi:hypothetical protein
MITQNEKIEKLSRLLDDGKIDSIVSLLRNEEFKTGLTLTNPSFTYFMYKLYGNRDYPHFSEAKAKDMLLKSIALKHPDACSEMGKNLLFGIGCDIDVLAAEDSFRQSQDCEQSLFYIAEIYFNGMATDPKGEKFYDLGEAKKQLKAVVALKGKFYNSALLNLSIIILKQGEVAASDGDMVIALLEELSAENSADGHNAKVLLGKFYLRKLKSVTEHLLKQDIIEPDSHYDKVVEVNEIEGLIAHMDGKLSGLSQLGEGV